MSRQAGPAVVAGLALLLAACSLFPATGSKGTMPPPAANGEVDPSTVPEFVAVAGASGIAGYVAKDAVLGPSEQSWPVYADDLRTVVGHLLPGRGFVPIGVDPASVPTFEVHAGPGQPNATPGAGQVLAYVRNRSSAAAWMAVVTGDAIVPGGAGFEADGYIGVWCGAVPPGSRLVLLDRSPVDRAARPKQTIYIGASMTDVAGVSVDVSPEGVASVGRGLPGWWMGGPPPC